MKIRTLSLACATLAAVLLAGCTAVYKNTDACEQMMRSKLADVPPEQLIDATAGKLSIDHRGTGIDGTRVVVEASLSRMQTAAEAAASAPKVAGAPAAAKVTAASGARAGSATQLASAPGAASAATTASAPATALAAASGASATLASGKPIKPKKLVKAVAAECTFTGLDLASFRWLAPKELVQTDSAASGTAE
ncbi:hypothetical protein [Paraburkholderia sp. BCC1885]|uniref:hypothetical protein n=1 Tax=Paraburkholderia sp. BCC1885 TaxID=2562669 RepID=UPI001182E828|nr:hypothetical protein [Paraburkholderia sp. BCC1885]